MIKETSKTKTIYTFGPTRKISLGIFLVGVTLLMYHGYCWGWWGRNNLLLQLIFQCGCPISSNESRYPERVDVIIPACSNDATMLSPSGRLLYVGNKVLWNDASYLLDLQTGEKTPVSIARTTKQVFGKPTPPKGSIHFLNDTLIFHTYYGSDEYILDWVAKKQYPIQSFEDWRSDAFFHGKANSTVLVESLREAEYIFLIGNNDIVALTEDFLVFPERNFFIDQFDVSGDSFETDKLEKLLHENGISFTYIESGDEYPRESLSLDGNFIARNDGIYLVDSKKIVDGYFVRAPLSFFAVEKYFHLEGWVYDGSGAIYSYSSGPCLIRYGFPFMDEEECLITVPQPVLKLKVPEEYLSSVSP